MGVVNMVKRSSLFPLQVRNDRKKSFISLAMSSTTLKGVKKGAITFGFYCLIICSRGFGLAGWRVGGWAGDGVSVQGHEGIDSALASVRSRTFGGKKNSQKKKLKEK